MLQQLRRLLISSSTARETGDRVRRRGLPVHAVDAAWSGLRALVKIPAATRQKAGVRKVRSALLCSSVICVIDNLLSNVLAWQCNRHTGPFALY